MEIKRISLENNIINIKSNLREKFVEDQKFDDLTWRIRDSRTECEKCTKEWC